MNPFLEPTVATPQPSAGWHRPSRRPGQRQSTSGSNLRAFLLAAAMLIPGLAMAVDINTATAEQLQEIKGIGPKTAGLIIEERERGGRFESFSDISDRVKGIGPKKAASLEAAGLTVGATVAAASKESVAPARTARRGR